MIPATGVDLQEEANKLKSNIRDISKTIDLVIADGPKSSNKLIGLYYLIVGFDAHVSSMQAESVTLSDITPYVQKYKGDWSAFQSDFTALNGTALPNLSAAMISIESNIFAAGFGPSSVNYADLTAQDISDITPSLLAVKAILS